MANKQLILMLDKPTWRLGIANADELRITSIACDPQASLATRAAAVQTLLADNDLDNQPLTLGLPASQCLTAPIDTTTLPRANRIQAMRYALEEFIPIPVEQLATAFILRTNQALGLGAEATELTQTIAALAQASIDVTAIIPTDLLALSNAIQTTPAANTAQLFLLQSSQQRISVFTLDPTQPGKPSAWASINDDPTSLRQTLAHHAAHHPHPHNQNQLPIYASGLSEQNLASLRAIDEVQLLAVDTHTSDHHATRSLQSPNKQPLSSIDFLPSLRQANQPANTPKLPRAVLAATLLLAITLPASLLLRSEAYNQIASNQRDLQQTQFDTYFHRPAPQAGLLRQFTSELNKARMGLTTTNSSTPYPSALSLMQHTLQLFPPNAKLAITRFEFAPDKLRIEGQAAQNEDAYALEKALNALHQLTPHVQQIQNSGARDSKRLFTLTTGGSP